MPYPPEELKKLFQEAKNLVDLRVKESHGEADMTSQQKNRLHGIRKILHKHNFALLQELDAYSEETMHKPKES